MNFFKTFLILTLSFVASAVSVIAAEGDTEAVLQRLKESRPDLKFTGIAPSPLQGFYSVQITNGPMVYVTADGKHFIAGDLFKVEKGGFVNLAEASRQEMRKSLLPELKAEDMIVFAPEEVKATVTVFTDIDCGYCQKLHLEVPELNRLGVAIRYLAYPRAGIGSVSYRKAATAWCADNPQNALTRLKNREQLDENVCAENSIAKQYSLGGRMGVTGTPALILDDGTLIPGYLPADTLARRVGAI